VAPSRWRATRWTAMASGKSVNRLREAGHSRVQIASWARREPAGAPQETRCDHQVRRRSRDSLCSGISLPANWDQWAAGFIGTISDEVWGHFWQPRRLRVQWPWRVNSAGRARAARTGVVWNLSTSGSASPDAVRSPFRRGLRGCRFQRLADFLETRLRARRFDRFHRC
jgi:hypothetical protein